MKLLITYGATREPIDGVRFISNVSSGRTGSYLANYYHDLGWQVSVLHAQSAKPCRQGIQAETFDTFSDYHEKLRELLQREQFDAVFHLAAVSDFSVREITEEGSSIEPSEKGKLSSSKELTLTLSPNPKVVRKVKSYALKPLPLVVGFKLTQHADPKERARAVERLAQGEEVDLVVHNDLSQIDPPRKHPFAIYRGDQLISSGQTPRELASHLRQCTEEYQA